MRLVISLALVRGGGWVARVDDVFEIGVFLLVLIVLASLERVFFVVVLDLFFDVVVDRLITAA
jgi:hypothetical protein